MKLVEVVILAGTHCISPLQHTDGLTDAAKVSCAVIVEKDTAANTISVMPPWQANAPEVRMAISAGPDALPGAEIAANKALRIEPAAAPPIAVPPPPPASENADAPASLPKENTEPDLANQSAEDPAAAEQDQPQDAESDAVKEAAPKKAQDRPVRLAEANQPLRKPSRTARASNGQCLGAARPAWYTNKDGRRKYRCVLPGKSKLY